MPSCPSDHRGDSPSAWIERFAPLIPEGGTVLDLACGRGRHARYLAQRGLRVAAVDRDAEAIAALAGVPNLSAQVADLEQGPWPYPDARFDAVVVTNYLWRPLLPRLLDTLDAAGVFLYETFTAGNEHFGRPSNADFLLRPGELLDVVRGRLAVIAFEDLCVDTPKPAMVQRICAVGGAHGLAVRSNPGALRVWGSLGSARSFR